MMLTHVNNQCVPLGFLFHLIGFVVDSRSFCRWKTQPIVENHRALKGTAPEETYGEYEACTPLHPSSPSFPKQ